MEKKNRKKKSKGSRSFGIFLKLYAGILAAVIIVVCAVLWSSLKKYQERYDRAEAQGNPDLYVSEFVKGLDGDAFLSYIHTYGLNGEGSLDYEGRHARYFAGLVKNSPARYERSEKFKKALPVYDIYSGNTRVAVISLKPEGKNDEFGYHKWQLKEMAFDTEIIDYHDITVRVPSGASVIYDGMLLGAENLCGKEESDDPVLEKALALGGAASQDDIYKIEDVIGEPELTVTDAGGAALEPEINGDGLYDYTARLNEEFRAGVEQRVFDTVNAYIYNIYNKKTFAEAAAYLEYGSDAYAVVADVQASIIWGWTPDTVDILEQSVSDCVRYGDNLFACSYYGKIYKYEEGAMESGEETFNYRMLFHKIDGQWYLNYFVLRQ